MFYGCRQKMGSSYYESRALCRKNHGKGAAQALPAGMPKAYSDPKATAEVLFPETVGTVKYCNLKKYHVGKAILSKF